MVGVLWWNAAETNLMVEASMLLLKSYPQVLITKYLKE